MAVLWATLGVEDVGLGELLEVLVLEVEVDVLLDALLDVLVLGMCSACFAYRHLVVAWQRGGAGRCARRGVGRGRPASRGCAWLACLALLAVLGDVLRSRASPCACLRPASFCDPEALVPCVAQPERFSFVVPSSAVAVAAGALLLAALVA